MAPVNSHSRPRAIGSPAKIFPLKGDQSIGPPVLSGGRKMRRIDKTNSEAWGPATFANRRASLERVTDKNEDLIRTFHPAFRSEPEVFALTQKHSGHQVWLIFPRMGDSIPFCLVGGRPLHTQPFFETPADYDTKYSTQMADPLLRNIDVREQLTTEDLTRIKSALPKASGIQIFQCECVIVFFETREDMLLAWEAGTPSTIGGLMVGYRC
ncbi:hypothetical protein N7462_002427 [Penicillium macrosclerotiorum]|uniref:uncharacterized protein n=1 Tax=Penicillium macrosclerotiorum TaxID=303699 RepID=UPI002547FF59|nr:uncharacterized protein N7462_002427 [Penicillium macrosclerotiorum]KAJ5693004.1 hypothetical protein N7462_002427 [Penicillium macrosclerotiorum]